MMDKLYKIADALNVKFPDGNEPFMIVTRLAKECDGHYRRVVDKGLVEPLAGGFVQPNVAFD